MGRPRKRPHSWLGHTTRHNEFAAYILEGAIFGKKAVGRPRNRRHSWLSHTIGHNEFAVNILERVIFGEKGSGKTSTTIPKARRQKHSS